MDNLMARLAEPSYIKRLGIIFMVHLSKKISTVDTRFAENFPSSEINTCIGSSNILLLLFLIHRMGCSPFPRISSMARITICLVDSRCSTFADGT